MRKWFGAAVVALLATPSHAQQDADGSLAKLPQSVREQMLEALDLNLFDGASARLRQVKSESDRIVCGLVNARTKSGNYTGFVHFFINTENKAVLLMSSGAEAAASRIRFNHISDGHIRKLCGLPSP